MGFSQVETHYVYVLVRKDLSLPQQAVQSCHAAIEATRLFITSQHSHPHLVLCGVRDESVLRREASRLEFDGVRFASFYEPDRGNELTAIATEPIVGEGRHCFRRYNLLDEECVSSRARYPP